MIHEGIHHDPSTRPRLLCSSPARPVAQEAPVPKLAIESYRLPNGLKVVLHRDPSVPRVTVCVAYHVGSKNESAGRTGFAHFFEHMMFRGTKNVPNYDIPLQETGAQSNAFTSEDMTVYFETVPTSFLDRALYLEAERLAFLPTALDQEKFDTEREVVKNERRQSVENSPYGLAEEAILANVFPKGHPYSWSVIGSMKDLDAASLKDLQQFFAEFYHPGNAALCLAGDFDPAEAKASIAKYFGPIPAGKPIKPVDAPTPSAARSRSRSTWPTRSASPGSTGPGRPSPTTIPTPRRSTCSPRSSATARRRGSIGPSSRTPGSPTTSTPTATPRRSPACSRSTRRPPRGRRSRTVEGPATPRSPTSRPGRRPRPS